VRDPWTGELLDWNATERLRRSMLGDDPTSALPAWFWSALRFAATHPRMTLEPEEILSEAWIAAAEMLRRRYGTRWPEAAEMFLTLRESPVGCHDLLAAENRAVSRTVRSHLEHDLLEQDSGWRKRRRRLQGHLPSRELPPDERSSGSRRWTDWEVASQRGSWTCSSTAARVAARARSRAVSAWIPTALIGWR
jgi:hypothetical protein